MTGCLIVILTNISDYSLSSVKINFSSVNREDRWATTSLDYAGDIKVVISTQNTYKTPVTVDIELEYESSYETIKVENVDLSKSKIVLVEAY